MNIKVYYVSGKGCSESIAQEIAKEANALSEVLMPAYPPENVALMFIGSEGVHADEVTLDFLKSMNPKRVRNAALFCNSVKPDSAALAQMRKVLEEKGVRVIGSESYPLKSFLGGKKPQEDDFARARAFAQSMMQKVREENL